MDTVIGFLPIMLIQSVGAFVAGSLAGRLGKNGALWVVLSLIPVFGVFFVTWYIPYRVAAVVLDKLDAIDAKLTTP